MSSLQINVPESAQDKKEVDEEAKNQSSAARKSKESARVEPKKEEEKLMGFSFELTWPELCKIADRTLSKFFSFG